CVGMAGVCANVVFVWRELKFLGPAQLKLPPVISVEKSFSVPPSQIAPPLLANVEGVALTVAVVHDFADGQPSTVTTTQYSPDFAVVAFGIVGFWSVELKLFGPVQL